MKYSVIIPAYNAAQTLERAVNAALAQSLPPAEVWIIDDASTDETYHLAQKLSKNPRIHCLHFEKNKGVSAARNAGWNAASGDWIAFLDSDDEWHPLKMQICLPFLEKTEVLCHQFQYESWEQQPLISPEKIQESKIKLSELLLRNKIATCTLLVSKNITLRYDETMRYAEDHDLLLRLSAHQPILGISPALARVHRRINSIGGLSGNLWAMRRGEMRMYAKLPQQNTAWLLAVPALILFSALKHLRLILKMKSSH